MCASGAAVGHDGDRVVNLEAANDQHDGAEERRGLNLRQGHIAELLPLVRAVHRRRFVEFARNALQRSEVDDHVVAHRAPHTDEDNRPHRHRRVRCPRFVEVDAQRHNHLIDRAIFHQHEVPADADSDHGGNIGEEENRAERDRALRLVQRQRQGNRAHQRQRHVNQRIEHGVFQRNAKVNAVEEV